MYWSVTARCSAGDMPRRESSSNSLSGRGMSVPLTLMLARLRSRLTSSSDMALEGGKEKSARGCRGGRLRVIDTGMVTARPCTCAAVGPRARTGDPRPRLRCRPPRHSSVPPALRFASTFCFCCAHCPTCCAWPMERARLEWRASGAVARRGANANKTLPGWPPDGPLACRLRRRWMSPQKSPAGLPLLLLPAGQRRAKGEASWRG